MQEAICYNSQWPNAGAIYVKSLQLTRQQAALLAGWLTGREETIQLVTVPNRINQNGATENYSPCFVKQLVILKLK
jgi:hypothetical protein